MDRLQRKLLKLTNAKRALTTEIDKARAAYKQGDRQAKHAANDLVKQQNRVARKLAKVEHKITQRRLKRKA